MSSKMAIRRRGMGRQYSIAQARNHLPGIIHEVERGSPVELTRRGKPVAVIVSLPQYRRLLEGKKDLWEAIQEFRQSPDFEPIDVDEVFEGVRDRSPGGRPVEW
jgi:antitoxin Phd